MIAAVPYCGSIHLNQPYDYEMVDGGATHSFIAESVIESH